MPAHDVYILINYCSLVILLVCCIAVYRQAASKMQKLALLVCFLSAVCCVGFLIKSQASDVSMYIAGQMIAYAVVAHGIFFVLLFVLEYCRFSLPSFVQAFFCGLNFVVTFGALTMGSLPFFYESCEAVSVGGNISFEKTYGPLHTFAIALLVFYLLAAIVIAVVFSVKNYRRKNYVWRILFALAVPFAAYLVPKFIDASSDLLPLSGAVFCVVMVYMIYQNKLYDIDNIMAKYSVDSIEEAYVVFDGKYRIKGWNAMAAQLFPVVNTLDFDCDIRTHETPFIGFLDGDVHEFRKDGKIYDVFVRTIGDRETPQGKVIRVEDVTIQRNYTELLQENVDRINQDLAMARSIQESALPDTRQVAAAVGQIDMAAFMQAAREVGGDFYDCYKLDGDRVVVLIADVSDKGIPAAMFMMRSKAMIRSFVEEGLAVDEVFNRADAYLAEGNSEAMFLTAWMGILNVQSGHMSFVSAGHERPVILRSNGQVEYLECETDFVLAVIGRTTYSTRELYLGPGDGIFLYTDGVTDANDVDGTRFGRKRLIDCLQSCSGQTAGEMLLSVQDGIERFVDAAEQFDDITMLALRYLGPQE